MTATNCFGIDRSKRYRTSSEQMKRERNELFGIITYSEWEPDQKCSKIWFLFSYFLWFMQINPALRTFPFEADWSKSALEWTVESYESFTKVESERSSAQIDDRYWPVTMVARIGPKMRTTDRTIPDKRSGQSYLWSSTIGLTHSKDFTLGTVLKYVDFASALENIEQTLRQHFSEKFGAMPFDLDG